MASSWTVPYRDAFQNGVRPYLTLHLTGPTGLSGDVVGLVDSGADRTCLPLGFATLMGYRAEDLEQEQGQQVSGTMDMWNARMPSPAYVVGLAEITFELWPSFVLGDTVLWGRSDFFRAFVVGFDEPEQHFTLTRP